MKIKLTGSNRSLRKDLKRVDLGEILHMCASAQLHRNLRELKWA
jgi:hypothetical protein